MSDDKIAEIRARHARHELVGSSGSVIHLTGFSWTIPGWVAHADRATLLAEVDRQRAEIERLLQAIGLVTTTVPDMEIDIENPVGMAQRVVAEVERLRADLLTQQGCCDGAASQDAHIRREREEHKAEVEKLRAEIDGLEAELALMKSGFEIAYRAMGDKP